MLDLEGYELTDAERDLISNPLVGGVIFFTRNYRDPYQLQSLVKDIRELRPEILIAVDHEGGRVQRFRQGFTPIPAMAKLGALFLKDPESALELAWDTGWLMASELLAFGIDFTFAPVLDLNYGTSEVIGDRAFSSRPEIVTRLADALIEGLHEAGMPATGKHFPGHGYVAADSHTEIPVDTRSFTEIDNNCLKPFTALAGQLDGIMPAHVIYPEVDPSPAGFSAYWLKDILRRQLGFKGVIFSDDLGMAGATIAGTYTARAHAALTAGCDMILVCNDRKGALEVLDALADYPFSPRSQQRLATLQVHSRPTIESLDADPRYNRIADQLEAMAQQQL
ncbi:beta-N-acetylhexosaminidase [Oceanospirillum multiglobuliferum]|nr:beta-N-acetylhexosaminidase [Oceanospirillum multiglobuliferum]